MDHKDKLIAWTLAMGVLLLFLGLATMARATPSGGYGQPFYTLTQQGKTMVMGKVTCNSSGSAVFLQGSSGAQSIMMRNAGSATVYVCPADNAICDAGNYTSAMYLKVDDALVLDKSTTVTAGWKCWAASSVDLHYLAEQ